MPSRGRLRLALPGSTCGLLAHSGPGAGPPGGGAWRSIVGGTPLWLCRVVGWPVGRLVSFHEDIHSGLERFVSRLSSEPGRSAGCPRPARGPVALVEAGTRRSRVTLQRMRRPQMLGSVVGRGCCFGDRGCLTKSMYFIVRIVGSEVINTIGADRGSGWACRGMKIHEKNTSTVCDKECEGMLQRPASH